MDTKFNFNNQVCTDRQQSERLLALGLKKETADMYYSYDIICAKPYHKVVEFMNGCVPEDIFPAWSLHRLIEMMPLDVIPEGGFDNCFTLMKNYPKGYSIEYDGFFYYHRENIYDTLIDSMEYLIKDGYFNKEYLEE